MPQLGGCERFSDRRDIRQCFPDRPRMAQFGEYHTGSREHAYQSGARATSMHCRDRHSRAGRRRLDVDSAAGHTARSRRSIGRIERLPSSPDSPLERDGFEPSVPRRGELTRRAVHGPGPVLALESRIDDDAPLRSRAFSLPPKAPRDRAKSCHLPPHRSIDSHLGKIAFAPLCQQCATAIVPALLRGQHHHGGKRALCRTWGVSRAHS